jgi:hypothetical protein
MDLPHELDPKDWRLLKAVRDALTVRAGQDARVAEDFGTDLAAKTDYAAFVCSRPGAWAAEILLPRGSRAHCRVATGVRLPPDPGARRAGWNEVRTEAGLRFDDLPDPRL